MKKQLLMLAVLVAMMHLGLSATNPADYITWAYGSYPGIPIGANNTMPTFGNVIGVARDGVKIEIPGSYTEGEFHVMNDEGVYETRYINVLDLSSKKVHIQGPIVEGTNKTKTDIYKSIFACYPTDQWPTPFENGKQECTAFRFGLSSYEVAKDPGLYRVTVPAGAIYFNGEPCEEFTVDFNVEDNTVYTPTSFNFEVSPLTNYPLEKLIYPQISINNRNEEDDSEYYTSKGVSPSGDVTLTNKETNEVRICPFANVGGSINRLVWEADLGGSVIETPGTYILDIPEGKIRLINNETGKYVTNYALQYTFIVANNSNKNYYDGAPNVIPAAGSVTALQCIEIGQPEGYAVALPSKVLPFTLIMADGTEKSVMPRDGWRGHTIYVDLDAPITTKGEYTLSIPEGGIVYYKATADGEIADENSPLYTRQRLVKYDVTWGQEADLAFTSNPADNSSIFKPLENVFITFDQSITPTTGLLATLKWPDGSTVHYPLDDFGNEDKTQAPYQYKVTYSAANNRFMVGLHYPQMHGKYELTIPAGIAKTADGRINKEFTITITWTEREVTDIEFTTDPANGSTLYTLPEDITLSLPSDVTSAQLSYGGITTVLFYTPNAETPVTRYIKESGSKYLIELRESYEYSKENEGLYTVQIPEGSFICTMTDGKEVYNAMKSISWRLAENGIYEVSVYENHVTVYDLNGNLLFRDADVEKLSTLKGVYIVNGIKTILH